MCSSDLVSGLPVAGYTWHEFPDGGATFAQPDGGWIYVSNSESSAAVSGGASAIRFSADGQITSAYRILGGTRQNCAGGPTPWGTWLSCEETGFGFVYECDPTGAAPARKLRALGAFKHEAAAVDPINRHVYLTEDKSDGRLYRFTPRNYPDLSLGVQRPNTVITFGGEVNRALVIPDTLAAVERRARRDLLASWEQSRERVGGWIWMRQDMPGNIA